MRLQRDGLINISNQPPVCALYPTGDTSWAGLSLLLRSGHHRRHFSTLPVGAYRSRCLCLSCVSSCVCVWWWCAGLRCRKEHRLNQGSLQQGVLFYVLRAHTHRREQNTSFSYKSSFSNKKSSKRKQNEQNSRHSPFCLCAGMCISGCVTPCRPFILHTRSSSTIVCRETK